MIDLIKKIKKDDKGDSILLYIGIVLIICYATTLFLDLLTKTWVFNELQGKLDIASKNTLAKVFSTSALREEMFYINSNGYIDNSTGNKVLSNYQDDVWNGFTSEINNSYTIGGVLVEVIPQKITISLDNTTKGLGFSKKSRPQLVLDTVLKVRVKASSKFDIVNSITYSFFNADSSSGTTYVTYTGVAEDGKAELIVRTNRRMVYK